MRRVSLCLALGAGLMGLRAWGWTTVDLSGDVSRQVVVAAGTEKVYNGHPTTALLEDERTLFCFWPTGHGGYAGNAACSRDAGLTWTRIDARLPAEAKLNVECPLIHRLVGPDGKARLWVWSGFRAKSLAAAQAPVGTPARAEAARAGDPMPALLSEDDGRTWRAMPPQDARFRCVLSFQAVLRLQDGSYLGIYHRGPEACVDRPPLELMASVTRDGGFTWSEPQVIAREKGLDFCEPWAFRSPDGKEICVLIRENHWLAPSKVIFSRDEGRTWTAPRNVPPGLTGHRHQGVVLPDGRVVVCMRDAEKGSPTLCHFVAWVGSYESIRSGKASPGDYRVKLLHSHAGGDCGYPGVHRLKDGTIVATTYVKYRPGKDRQSIVSVRFKIDETDRLLPVTRDTCSVEPISTDTMYPGAAPFHGARELRFKVEPAFTGKATLVLSTESKGAAKSGRMCTYAGTGTAGEIRFPVNQLWPEQYEFMQLDYAPEASSPKGPYRIVRAEGTFHQTRAEAMRLEVDTRNPLHICRDESERPELIVRNPTAEDIAWSTVFELSDVFGRSLAIPFDRTVRGGETVRVPVPWPLPAKGVWFVKACVQDRDGCVARHETRFACIDRHDVTPVVEKPAFRFGIHYHGTKYWPHAIDKTIAAMVAAGAKFTRCDYDHMWADIEWTRGKYVWAKSDAMIEKLRAAGLALDIILFSEPPWAVDEEAKKLGAACRQKGQRVRCLKLKPGVFREFCTQYAQRYGTRIDYYEVGNELDLTSLESFPHDVALAIQREAYEGLHAGCPGVCVTTSGWAYPFTEPNATPDRWNVGIIEHFAEHPETYDCWAVHVHGSFAKYSQLIDGGYAALRNRTGLKTRPWIANETANTTAFGQEIPVARQVWEKPLFAWSRGARDYIWYNLRATGWFDGSEPGFGLITADYHPRATYAAFAALTTIFQGLDYDGALHSQRLRHLLRFRGRSQALAEGGLVLAGWDDQSAPGAVRNVRIRTDARRAAFSDHMGNRTPAAICDGVVVFPMGLDPKALLLYGATRAESVDAAELTRALGGPRRIDLANVARGPDFTLGDPAHVKSYYEANPPYVHRLWKGADDLSARLYLARDAAGRLGVRVEVVDDVQAPGDGVEFYLAPHGAEKTRHVLARTSSAKGRTTYEGTFDMPSGTFGLDLRVLEDDGEGPDGYLMLCREGEDPVEVELTF